jgi:hypothetical protein
MLSLLKALSFVGVYYTLSLIDFSVTAALVPIQLYTLDGFLCSHEFYSITFNPCVYIMKNVMYS